MVHWNHHVFVTPLDDTQGHHVEMWLNSRTIILLLWFTPWLHIFLLWLIFISPEDEVWIYLQNVVLIVNTWDNSRNCIKSWVYMAMKQNGVMLPHIRHNIMEQWSSKSLFCNFLVYGKGFRKIIPVWIHTFSVFRRVGKYIMFCMPFSLLYQVYVHMLYEK